MGRFARGVLYFFTFVVTVSLAVLMIIGFNVDFRLAGLISSLAFLALLYWVNKIDRNHAEQRLAIKLNDLENIVQTITENHQIVTDQLTELSQDKLLDDQGPIKRMSMQLQSQEAVIHEITRTVARLETSAKLISSRLDIIESDIAGLTMPQAEEKVEKKAKKSTHDKPKKIERISKSEAEKANLIEDKQQYFLKALDHEAVDIHLQSIVTLPQRRTIFYEALTRLIGPKNETIMPSSFLPTVSEHQRLSELDEIVFYKSVHLLRRLVIKNKDVGMFCNISSDLLRDTKRFPKVMAFIEANRAFVPSVIFQFTQASLQSFGATELESLNALKQQGVRFSLDNLFALSTLDFSDLSDWGFRYIKIPVDVMLGKIDLGKSDIHLADMAHLLSRNKIQLIIEKVERESDLVEVLDYDANLAQGHLFSRPRPVKNDQPPSQHPYAKQPAADAATGT